jgi:threonine/homoserine/homoserine lactone efflux protein
MFTASSKEDILPLAAKERGHPETMEPGTLVKGFLAGAAIAAPLGPVGILCIHRGISSGRRAAFLSGLGAATAHGVYALAAALGLSLAAGALARHQFALRLAAGLLLVLLGARTFASRPADPDETGTGRALAGAYVSALLLAISSPVTMLTIAAVFSGAGLPAKGGGTFDALLLAAGVFLGSTAWWLALSAGVGWLSLRGKIPALRHANRATGAVLAGFGLYILFRLFAAA